MSNSKIETSTDLHEGLIEDLNKFRNGNLSGKDLRNTAYAIGKAVSLAKLRIEYDHHMRTVTKQKFLES